ncbi:phosphoglycerol transferase family protein, alkaline phosphatase superfamily [Thermanaerovibrio velox DSM 12556]|uniref:Phosphoglycerol transferase family protein, alkaline phosphatase superfamily n=1 Tax=Thermanaerovibrio velox DSM 12556 TaxID=926567 RepID=H0UP39_9BACT|nr:sulfatase-like hydrolase/transferase [Thermanaerovibrio velox]EHM10542.1 phosphoglycerol transferase family protein, alkaline phosphatase superfamily [Thermanaerovibrio velox DSM 12556]
MSFIRGLFNRLGFMRSLEAMKGDLVWFLAVWAASALKLLAVCDGVFAGSYRYPQVLWSTILGVLPFAGLPLLLPRRFRLLGMFALSAGFSALCLADLLSFRYYSDLFTVRSLVFAGQLGDVSDSVWALLTPEDGLCVLDLPLLFAAAVVRLYRARRDLREVPLKRRILFPALCLLGLTPFLVQSGIAKLRVPGYIKAMWDRPAVMMSLGPVGYHLADLINASADLFSSKAVAAEEEEALVDWAVKRSAPDKLEGRGGLAGAGRGLNLIMIQVEALQGFVINRSVGGQEITPNLNRLVRESIYFPNTYNQTSLGNSADAEFMAQTSMFPASKGVAYTRFFSNAFESLPKALKRSGYATLALHGDKASFWNRHRMYPSLGFDRYVSREKMRFDEAIGLGLSDRSFFAQASEILSREKGPFYAFLVTLTSHYPYSFEGIPRALKLDAALEGTLLGDYLQAIHYADAQIGMFLRGLKSRGLLDRSVVVLYGDHVAIPSANKDELGAFLGEDMGEAFRWRAAQTVPFMIRMPHGKGAGVMEISTGHMDIAPTVASIMGVEMPLPFGQDLLSARVGNVVFRNGTFIRGSVLVDPAAGRAASLRTGEAVDFNAYRDVAEEAAELLRFSDLLLEKDMVERVCQQLP